MTETDARRDWIEYGSTDGVHFTEWRFARLGDLAAELRPIIPEATGWRIWYDRFHDFHRLEFDLDGRHYVVRLYKIYTIHFDDHDSYLDPEFPVKNYGRSDWNLVRLFASGRYKTWEDA